MNGVIRNLKLAMLLGTMLSAPAAFAGDLKPLPMPPSLSQLAGSSSGMNGDSVLSLDEMELPPLPDAPDADADAVAAAQMAEDAAAEADVAAQTAEDAAEDAAEAAIVAESAAEDAADLAEMDELPALPPLPADEAVASEENEAEPVFSFEDQSGELDAEPSIIGIAEPEPENDADALPAGEMPDAIAADSDALPGMDADGMAELDALDNMDMLPPPPALAGEAAPADPLTAGQQAAQAANEELGAPTLDTSSEEVFSIFGNDEPTVVATPPKPKTAEKEKPVEKKQVAKPAPKKNVAPLVKLPKEYRLPSTIYKKEYSRDNGHLPAARYEHEYDAQMFLATGNDRPETVRSLLNTGRSIEMRNADGDTPLLYAVRTNAQNTLRMLLGKGANPNATNNRGVSALHYAILAHSPRMAEALLEMGADPNQPDITGVTPLMLAANEGNDPAFTSLLIHRGAVVNLPSADGRTPLHVAAQTDNARAAALLVRAGADVNMRNVHGNTPLMTAAITGSEAAAVVLLNAGADTQVADPLGRSALDLARGRGHRKVANAIMGSMLRQDRALSQNSINTGIAPM